MSLFLRFLLFPNHCTIRGAHPEVERVPFTSSRALYSSKNDVKDI